MHGDALERGLLVSFQLFRGCYCPFTIILYRAYYRDGGWPSVSKSYSPSRATIYRVYKCNGFAHPHSVYSGTVLQDKYRTFRFSLPTVDADDEEESSGPLFEEVNLCYLTILDYIAGGEVRISKGTFSHSKVVTSPWTIYVVGMDRVDINSAMLSGIYLPHDRGWYYNGRGGIKKEFGYVCALKAITIQGGWFYKI